VLCKGVIVHHWHQRREGVGFVVAVISTHCLCS
jgi:hypothetical protein